MPGPVPSLTEPLPNGTLNRPLLTLRSAFGWLAKGCEMGMYPYVIPFSGSAMARDEALKPFTVYNRQRIQGTEIEWDQPTKILPVDPVVRDAVEAIEIHMNQWLDFLHPRLPHVPSRLRSMLWTLSAAPVLRPMGLDVPSQEEVLGQLLPRLPHVDDRIARELRVFAGRQRDTYVVRLPESETASV